MSIHCPYCDKTNSSANIRNQIVCAGYFTRKADNTRHQRFNCKPCKRSFSSASFHPCYRQKKRELNPKIFISLVSGVSQRRLARIHRVNRKTIVRKFLFLGLYAHDYFLNDRAKYAPACEVEFDDLETFEHSKLKPISVIMAIESKTRRILGFRVADMPAKGLLVKRSLKKYGKRRDGRRKARESLFTELKECVNKNAIFKSDENPHYPSGLKRHFPECTHKDFKGRRGCVVGQGELKAGGFDPIFSLNHSFAMLRANISRLFRRSWNTTKKKERLSVAIGLYALYHNLELIHNPSR